MARRSSRESRRHASLAALITALLLGTSAVAAHADPWGTHTSDTGPHPDSDPHTYCYSSSIGNDAQENISNAEWDALDPTAVRVEYNSTCDLSSGTETDVVWRQDDLAGEISGSTRCEDFDTYCDQAYVTLDMAEIGEGSYDETDETQTACHELGHTAGLTHGGSVDCMINSGDSPPTALQFRRYGAHHRDHLTNWFN